MTASSQPRPWLAGLLSLLQLGLGHLYARDAARGIALAAGAGLLVVVFAWSPLVHSFAGLVAILVFALAADLLIAVDAVRRSRLQQAAPPKWYNRWYVYVLFFFGIAFVVGPVVKGALPVRAFRIPVDSMAPALVAGDHLLAQMRGLDETGLRRGDLVVFASPESSDLLQIKRIVAVGGETVEIRNKEVFVNGQRVSDPHAHHTDPTTYPRRTPLPWQRSRDQLPVMEVPEGYVFVLGDNRDDSNDSRYFGPVPNERLLGRPLYIYWSRDLSRIGRRLD